MLLMVLYLPTNNFSHITAMVFLLGLVSSPQILVFAFAFERTKKTMTATALAVTNMLVSTSGFVQPLIGKVVEYGSIFGSESVTTEHFTQAQFEQAFLFMPIMLLLAFLLTFMVKTHRSSYAK